MVFDLFCVIGLFLPFGGKNIYYTNNYPFLHSVLDSASKVVYNLLNFSLSFDHNIYVQIAICGIV